MNEAIYALTLSSMQADMERLNGIASNLANVSTTGYKRQITATRPFGEMLGLDGALQSTQVMVDGRSGTMRVTNQPLDLAILGEAFFEVMTDNGPVYTRNGNFSLDVRGRLVTAQGWPVMGKNGEIQLAHRTPVIDPQGFIHEQTISEGQLTSAVAQLKLVKFDNLQQMQRLGQGLWASGSALAQASQDQVKQGALENANVSPAKEMVDLIQTMRHFESTQKLIQGYDEMMGLAIKKLTE
jgi:flagellar basal-body rod protein FlgF